MNTVKIYKSPQGEKLMMDFYDRMLEMWPVAYAETDVSTSFGNTHVITAGSDDSPPLVLLHGSTSNSTTWAGDISGYAREFKVYAIDMPGEPGKSTRTRLSWQNREYADWLREVFNAIGLEKANIAGLSLGGWAALKFAAAYPEKTGKVALIAPGGVVNPNMKAVMKMISYASQGEKGVEKTFRLLFPDDFESPEVREFFTLLNEHFNIRSEAVKPLPDSELSKIESPVFMVCGANDAFFNFKKARKRIEKLIPRSKTMLFKKGTHGLVSVSETIIPFLK
ncbi:MAG: alpha/beta hydrolase [Clostridia bacterium]|nr:alpha/beta hydrolase [Clostridia bacterium]